MLRSEVYTVLDGEREYQDVTWGEGKGQTVGGSILLMQEYLAAAAAEWASSETDGAALDAMRKVVALGVRCFEVNGVPSR